MRLSKWICLDCTNVTARLRVRLRPLRCRWTWVSVSEVNWNMKGCFHCEALQKIVQIEKIPKGCKMELEQIMAGQDDVD